MLPLVRSGLLILLVPAVVPAADWTISNFAGIGGPGSTGDGGPAISAQLNDPYGLVRGPDGALWFCEHNGNRIRRIAPDGTITTVAGTGLKGLHG